MAQPRTESSPRRLPPDLHAVASALTPGAHVAVTGVPPATLAYLVARLQSASDRVALVVVDSTERGRALTDALNGLLDETGALPAAAFYPDLGTSPYAGLSPNRGHAMERLAVLFRLSQSVPIRAVVTTPQALALHTIPNAQLASVADIVMAGETVDRERFTENLVAAGYHRVPIVEDPGTFAVRGGLLDVFVPLYDRPARIDFWGDTVETIRTFDPDSQRSVGTLSELFVLPAREALLDAPAIRRGQQVLREMCDQADVPTSRMRALVAELDSGILGLDTEFLLPALVPAPATLLDYLPADTFVVAEDPGRLTEGLHLLHARLQTAFEAPRTRELFVFPPERYFLSPEAVSSALSRHARLSVLHVVVAEEVGGTPPTVLAFATHDDLGRELRHAPGGERSLRPLADYARRLQREGLVVAVSCHNDGQADRLAQLLRHYGLAVTDHAVGPSLARLDGLRAAREAVHLFRAALEAGFRHDAAGLAVIDEEEIFGRKRRVARDRTVTADDLLPRLSELNPGDLVVHTEHGIGRFEGLEKLVLGGRTSDFLRIRYQGNDTLLLPVHNLNRIQRYLGAGDTAPALDKLGGSGWERRKGRARRAVLDIADDLLKLYAERAATPGHAFAPPDQAYREFEAAFPYDETPHQTRAINEVMDDMSEARPMDRLVCGDVGFGKTEVALRAAFRAVADGMQVAVLVPTTVLAEQHRMTFEDRLGPHGVLVDALSRFKTAREQKETLKRLAEGRLDVVIGTHRLLSKDVSFARLGLVIVDEEHRFGVTHKERLKTLCKAIDVLTLTATPIPRTLSMALAGLRDLSVITTPPQERLAIRTVVTRGTDEVIRDGLERELARGGQVFFVHNRVETIYERAQALQELVPQARIGVGHAQLSESALEDVMLKFVRREVNVLVCTTIIESGLDIPNANTLFVDRADTFGLAQLYQIRGRIGRGRERAFAYLLVPNPAGLEGDARRRIEVIQRFSELGAGFHIASYDLEIRGAGSLLGANQSGHVQAVGYDLFLSMLEEAVRELKTDAAPPALDPELRIELPAYLPEEWLPEAQERVRLYRRLASAETREALEHVAEELVDRFGAPPPPVVHLIETLHAKREAREVGVREVVFGPTSLMLTPEVVDAPAPGRLTRDDVLAFLNRPGNRFRLSADMKLTCALSPRDWQAGFATLHRALHDLKVCATARR